MEVEKRCSKRGERAANRVWATTILKPFLPSLSVARKPRSWMAVIAQSLVQPEKAVLSLRGNICVSGWRTK